MNDMNIPAEASKQVAPFGRTVLDMLCAAPDDAVAVILPEDDLTMTYGDLREEVVRLAVHLLGEGIAPRSRIATIGYNGSDTLISFFAAAIVGAVAPLNPDWTADELLYYASDWQVATVLDSTGNVCKGPKTSQRTIDIRSFRQRLRRVKGRASLKQCYRPAPDDVALMLHTSGSTGRPKRVALLHSQLSRSAWNIRQAYSLESNDVTICVMPMFHVHGLMASVLATFISGGCVVLPTRFNPLSFWRLVRKYRVTWFSAVPTIHRVLLLRADTGKVECGEHLRFIRSCSAPLTKSFAIEMERVFGVPVVEAYGMTECAHQICTNLLAPGMRKAGTVGVASGVRVSIMDASGRRLPPGDRGEVIVSGPSVITQYDGGLEADTKSFVDGWFRTGDEGCIDEDGFLTLTGRIKEMINRGGEKISPSEIDAILLSHTTISEAVTFAVPHPIWGEEVAAAVVVSSSVTEAEIITYCAQNIAEFKCPKKVFIVDSIPRTATGKVQRRVVAAAILASDRQ
ncbi:MAG: AMP-binding protein [Bryobacteraceae bacterium]